MAVQLFEHNQKAYAAAVAMLEQEGKAAIVHPTGTGKSFIAFQLVLHQRDKRILWLGPSEYIYATQLESLKGGSRQNDSGSRADHPTGGTRCTNHGSDRCTAR